MLTKREVKINNKELKKSKQRQKNKLFIQVFHYQVEKEMRKKKYLKKFKQKIVF